LSNIEKLAEVIKNLIKKFLRDILHIKVQKVIPKQKTESFWLVNHPICIFDDKTNKESPLKEFQKVRFLLKKDRETGYPDQNIEFGDFTYGNPKIWNFNKNIRCKIGKYCSIAFGTTLLVGGEHCVEWLSTYPFGAFMNYFQIKPETEHGVNDICIGNDVWIGSDVKIMSGVIIGDGCVIGANTLILKNTVIPDYSIWAGVPARQIRKRFPDEVILQFKRIQWWDWSDEDICNVIPILQNGDIYQLINYYENNIIGNKIL
jgi:acetyltransferase-like isoleucine patch superfamily enzyme